MAAAYGSLDNVIANADKISGKVGENLRASLSTVGLARELATIKCDIELTETIDSLTPQAEIQLLY